MSASPVSPTVSPTVSPAGQSGDPRNATGLTEDGQDVILIEGLLVPVEIGILESERGRTQSVCIDVEIRTVPGYRQIFRETGAYVSYADTVEFVQDKAVSGGHTDMVEDWAEAVAGFVLTNPLADRVTVKVTKLDIFDEAAGVGIRISRKRSE
ncbi:dihydroneopterin aldolase [Roseibium marinum]|uniref:dihydroneopterin aldolase n=1 Tax=Roseibium marinum TaxID=281252 RepID=A0A2S3UJF4_9HYPH|nr:dihydroneopterin aldolase [Roseibium marinum]POF27844.1 dihydroneopterin aldolase [Roseibium marinum]